MDYIREELLRQRSILSVLMAGGQNDGTEEHRTVENETLKREQGMEQQDHRPRTFGQADQLFRLSGRSVWPTDRTEEKRRSGIRSGRGTERRRKNPVIAEDNAELFQTILHESVVSETVTDVRTLSRSIQRDARRYEGGFTIY